MHEVATCVAHGVVVVLGRWLLLLLLHLICISLGAGASGVLSISGKHLHSLRVALARSTLSHDSRSCLHLSLTLNLALVCLIRKQAVATSWTNRMLLLIRSVGSGLLGLRRRRLIALDVPVVAGRHSSDAVLIIGLALLDSFLICQRLLNVAQRVRPI